MDGILLFGSKLLKGTIVSITKKDRTHDLEIKSGKKKYIINVRYMKFTTNVIGRSVVFTELSPDYFIILTINN